MPASDLRLKFFSFLFAKLAIYGKNVCTGPNVINKDGIDNGRFIFGTWSLQSQAKQHWKVLILHKAHSLSINSKICWNLSGTIWTVVQPNDNTFEGIHPFCYMWMPVLGNLCTCKSLWCLTDLLANRPLLKCFKSKRPFISLLNSSCHKSLLDLDMASAKLVGSTYLAMNYCEAKAFTSWRNMI